MALATSKAYADDLATRDLSPVSKDGAAAASEPAAAHAPAETGADVLQTISRVIYSGSYALAYGLVYATVLVVQLLPQDNPVMHGFHDGGKAAIDELSRS